MSENDAKVVSSGELLTLNQISNITGGHYQTVKKIIDRYVKDKVLIESTVKRKNRDFPAYNITNTQLAEIQIELQNIKKNSAPLKTSANDNMRMSENITHKSDSMVNTLARENDSMKMIDNVKFYEVVKQNNELENKVRMLEAQYKDLELSKANEVTTLKAEQTKTEAELYKTQADLKLITDKSSTMESAYAEQKLEVERLNKVVRNRNTALILLGAILLIIITVACTILYIR